MQNKRTQRLLLCVLLSLVVHVGLAATFVSAIHSKTVHLEIVNPIQVSLVQEVPDAIGTAASQSVESDLNQFIDSGTQTNLIELIQLAEDSTDSANEVAEELVSAAVASVDANQPTDFSDIDKPTLPLPIVKKEVKKEIPDAEVQSVQTESSDISPNTEQLSESNKLESTDSAYVKADEEPIPTKSESVRDLHLTEPVENLTSQVTNSRIDNEIEHIWESEHQTDSNIIAADGINSPMQAGAEIAVDISDADELAGILFSGVVEPATTKFDQPPSKESSPEEIIAESQIQAADIAELSHPVSIIAIEVVQFSPPEIIDDEHITDEIASTSSLETESDIDEQFTEEALSDTLQIAYSRIDNEIKHIWESNLQSDSDITSSKGVDSPIQAGVEISADISDADELAGIWPTEEIEPAVVDSDHLPPSEVTLGEIVASQIQVASATDLIELIQHDANQVEPEYPPAPTFLVSEINQITSDLKKETTNEKTAGLNDSWLTDQVPTATDQFAYAIPKPEPTPIQKEIHAIYKTPLKDEPLRETNPPEITTTEQVIELEVDESETKRKETVSDRTVENQPEFDYSSPLKTQESPDRIDLAETDEKSILKERHQVASIDPVQQTVNSSDQVTANTVTQITGLGDISSDVGPKYGIEGLPNQAPRYPYLSRANDEQGRVILRVVVDRKGRAKEVKILESSGYSRLDKAARKAVKRWRFQPAQKNGQSTQGVVQVPINFVLDNS